MCVVFAHACGLATSTPSSFEIIEERLCSIIGTIGVPLFFFCSGFLLAKSKTPFKHILLKKLLTIIIPWVISGTVVYLYVYLRKGPLNILTYLYFLIGNGSYLYFLPVYLVFIIIFSLLRKISMFSKITIFVSSCFLCILFQTIYLYKGLNVFPISPYLNPLLYLPFFSFGFLFKGHWFQDLITSQKVIALIASLSLTIVILVFHILNVTNITYFNILFIPFIFSMLPMFLFLVDLPFLFSKKSRFILYIGKKSFGIYLYHMPMAGIVSFLFNKLPFYHFAFFRPFLVVAIATITIYFVNKFLKFIKAEKASSFLGI